MPRPTFCSLPSRERRPFESKSAGRSVCAFAPQPEAGPAHLPPGPPHPPALQPGALGTHSRLCAPAMRSDAGVTSSEPPRRKRSGPPSAAWGRPCHVPRSAPCDPQSALRFRVDISRTLCWRLHPQPEPGPAHVPSGPPLQAQASADMPARTGSALSSDYRLGRGRFAVQHAHQPDALIPPSLPHQKSAFAPAPMSDASKQSAEILTPDTLWPVQRQQSEKPPPRHTTCLERLPPHRIKLRLARSRPAPEATRHSIPRPDILWKIIRALCFRSFLPTPEAALLTCRR